MNKTLLNTLLRAVTGLLTLAATLTSAPAAIVQAEQQDYAVQKTGIFRGAWFDVSYPADFSVKPSLKSTTAEGYDSAEFISSDGAVSFYVFAPQWGGNATDIALIPEHEQLVTEQRRQVRDREMHWFTIAARDGSYHRSYQETIARQGSVKTVVGIRYKNEVARLRYQKAYQLFRSSLKLYAD